MKNKITSALILCVLALGGGMAVAQEKNHEKKAEKTKGEEKRDDKKAEEVIKEIFRRLDIGAKIYMDWYAAWGQTDV